MTFLMDKCALSCFGYEALWGCSKKLFSKAADTFSRGGYLSYLSTGI